MTMLFFIFGAFGGLQVHAELPPPAITAQKVRSSSFSSCQKHQFKWISPKTQRQWGGSPSLAQTLKREFRCGPDSNQQILFSSTKPEMSALQRKTLLRDALEESQAKARENLAKTEGMLACFNEKVSPVGADCGELVKKEQSSLKTKLGYTRILASLGQVGALRTTKTGAYSRDLPLVQMQSQKSWPALSQEEASLAQMLIQSDPQIQSLQKRLSDTSYQKEPRSIKNFGFHEQVPLKLKEVVQACEVAYQKELSQTPVLKFLLPQSDPVQDYHLTTESLREAYTKLVKHQREALKILEKLPEEDCSLVHLNTFDVVLGQHLARETPPNLELCRVAEELKEDCQHKEAIGSTVTGLGVLTTCVFASPVVCAAIGMTASGAEVSHQWNQLQKLDAEHGLGIGDYTKVVAQREALTTALKMAPLGVVPVAVTKPGRAMLGQQIKEITEVAASFKVGDMGRLTQSLARWSELAPKSTEGVMKIFKRAQEIRVSKTRSSKGTPFSEQEAIEESLRENLSRNTDFRAKTKLEQEKDVSRAKACLGLGRKGGTGAQ